MKAAYSVLKSAKKPQEDEKKQNDADHHPRLVSRLSVPRRPLSCTDVQDLLHAVMSHARHLVTTCYGHDGDTFFYTCYFAL